MSGSHDEQMVTIRPAVVDEAGAIASILLAAFEEFRPLYTDGGFAATTPTREQIVSRWDEGPVWVAERGEIVGTVAAVVSERGLYVRSMALLPAARGHGVGRLLLEHVERLAVARGCARMYLSTTPFLHSAIALYERFGFERIADGPHDLHGTPLLTMEKRLPDTTGSIEGEPRNS